ncbi:hypothetical protein JCM17960_34070 [Magnetospira thiophila]
MGNRIQEANKEFAAEKQDSFVCRDIVDHHADLICQFLADGTLVFANRAYCRFFGLDPAHIENSKFTDFLSEDDRAFARAHYQSLTPAEPERSQAYRCTGPKGDPVWIEWRHVGKMNDRGALIEVLAFGRDITDRKIAAQTILSEKARAETYLDIAGVMIITLDTKGTVTMVNRRGCDVLGWSAKELVGRNWFDTCLPPDVCQEVKEVARRVGSGDLQVAAQHTNEILTKSGERRLISWYNTMLTDDAGKIVGLLSSGEDITERTRAERALVASEKLKKQILNALPDLVWLKDTEGYYLA